jgi:integrase
MPSAFITRRSTKSGPRYVVRYRLGGRYWPIQHGGSFRKMKEATIRRDLIAGELAAGRNPAQLLEQFGRPQARVETLRELAPRYEASRIDYADETAKNLKSHLKRILECFGDRDPASITWSECQGLVAAWSQELKPSSVSRYFRTLRLLLDFADVDPNPARDKRVRLPLEERDELAPPSAEHVVAVLELLPSALRLPLLWLDWSGARVGSVDTLTVGDYDEPLRRVLLRRSTTKTKQPLWVELPEVLADEIEQRLGPREDRDPSARLFPGVNGNQLRTAIGRACKASGIPVWSPHDLRHRRISLLHRQGRSWAEIARFVGQRKLSLTADTYTHVLVDEAEVDYAEVLR